MATTSGRTPAYTNTGASTEPCGDVTLTISPSLTSSLLAVSGWTSTQECQVILVTGSAFSSSHGLLVPRPSYSIPCGYGRKTNSPLPSSCGRVYLKWEALEASETGAAGACSKTPPRCT